MDCHQGMKNTIGFHGLSPGNEEYHRISWTVTREWRIPSDFMDCHQGMKNTIGFHGLSPGNEEYHRISWTITREWRIPSALKCGSSGCTKTLLVSTSTCGDLSVYLGVSIDKKTPVCLLRFIMCKRRPVCLPRCQYWQKDTCLSTSVSVLTKRHLSVYLGVSIDKKTPVCLPRCQYWQKDTCPSTSVSVLTKRHLSVYLGVSIDKKTPVCLLRFIMCKRRPVCLPRCQYWQKDTCLSTSVSLSAKGDLSVYLSVIISKRRPVCLLQCQYRQKETCVSTSVSLSAKGDQRSPTIGIRVGPWLHVSTARCVHDSMYPWPDVSMIPCIHGPMCPWFHVSTARCVHGVMYPRPDVSTVWCIHCPMCLWSDVSSARSVHGLRCLVLFWTDLLFARNDLMGRCCTFSKFGVDQTSANRPRHTGRCVHNPIHPQPYTSAKVSSRWAQVN